MLLEKWGIFSNLVQTGGFLITASTTILLTWKGRAKWEPSEEDIPKGSQKIAGLLTSILLAILWSFFANYESKSIIILLIIWLSILTLFSLFFYSYIIAVHTYSGGKGKKIIGGFKILPKASFLLSQENLTIQELLKRYKYDPDKLWKRNSRAMAKVMFMISYILMTVCGTISLTSASILLIYKDNNPNIKPTHKTSIQIAIALSGSIYYTNQIMNGFETKLNELLDPSDYIANYEFVVLNADATKKAEYKIAMNDLFEKFPENKIDYLVTIGTQASEYAMSNYFGTYPIVFIGVTDPVRSKLIIPNKDRGNIAGVCFNIPINKYLGFFIKTFPNKNFGFIYNPKYNQDIYFKDLILKSASQSNPKVKITPIIVNDTTLSKPQEDSADIFFGRYYLAQNIAKFIKNSHKPFVAADISNINKGAIACISTDATELGRLAAKNIVFLNLTKGKSLASIPIINPTLAQTAVNLKIARKYNMSIPDSIINNANIVIE